MAIVTERVGDIFSAPPNGILIHACNARGSWSAGVALAFKKRYPTAYQIYNAHCTAPPPGTTLSAHQASLVGTTLLIPPVEPEAKGKEKGKGKRHWIACLFTSLAYGRNVSKLDVILTNTRKAVEDLRRQIEALKAEQKVDLADGEEGKELPGECWAVRINSGLFKVPWAETRKVLEDGGVDIVVVRPEGDGEVEVEGEAKAGENAAADEVRKTKADKGKSATEKGSAKRPAPVHAGLEKRRKKTGFEGWLKP